MPSVAGIGRSSEAPHPVSTQSNAAPAIVNAVKRPPNL
jgi:hypothetical protein